MRDSFSTFDLWKRVISLTFLQPFIKISWLVGSSTAGSVACNLQRCSLLTHFSSSYVCSLSIGRFFLSTRVVTFSSSPWLATRVLTRYTPRKSKRGKNISHTTCLRLVGSLCSYHVLTSSLFYHSTHARPKGIFLLTLSLNRTHQPPKKNLR